MFWDLSSLTITQTDTKSYIYIYMSCYNLELLGNTKYQFTGQSAVTNIRQDRTRTEGRRDETYHKTAPTMII